MNLLGIDVGTGGTRAVVVDETGSVVAAATAEHAPFASPQTGWAEQDPRDWWRAAAEAVRNVLTQPNVSADQMHASAYQPDAWRSLARQQQTGPETRADLRSTNRFVVSCDHEDVGERLTEPTCSGTNHSHFRNCCGCASKSRTYGHASARCCSRRITYLVYWYTRMLRRFGTLLFDVVGRRWSDAMLDAMTIKREYLPEVYESQEIAGQVSTEGAGATGLRPGTPVVAGAGDQAAGAIGMGIVRPGAVSATIGTSGVVFAATDRPALDQRGRVHTFCHAVPGCWHVMGVTQAAGLSLRWFRDRFGVLADAAGTDNRDPYELLCEEAALAPEGSDGVLWTPYLMGERTPHLDPNARASLVGLTAVHTRAHIIRAILEGVAFSLRDTLTIFAEMKVPVETIRLGGGGARSSLWRQIQADVYGRDVEVLVAEEGAAYGAALLAGVGAKVWSSVDEACEQSVRVARRVEPNSAAAALMNDRYAAYRAIYPALQAITDRRQASG